jgi:hypothetical protein
LLIAESNRLRRVDLATGVVSLVAGGGSSVVSVGALAGAINISAIRGLAIDATGRIWLTNNGQIFALSGDPLKVSVVYGLSGNDSNLSGVTPPTLNSILSGRPNAAGLAVDSEHLYFSQNIVSFFYRTAGGGSGVTTPLRIIRIKLDNPTSAEWIAGRDYQWTVTQSGLPATSSSVFYNGGEIAKNANQDLIFIESSARRIRAVSALNGTIETVAGTGISGTFLEGSNASSATINPSGVIVNDRNGNLFFV